MRVVVHHPEREEDDRTVPASKAAYRLGRIEDWTNPLTGETTPKAEVAEILLAQAREEFPDLDVTVEHLHEGEVENGEVVTHEWKDHPPEQPVAAGDPHAVELSAQQAQEASA